MAELSARQIALTALRLWRKEKHFADFIISGLLTKTELNASDRAFALELFYGVLRNLTLLDFWIGCLRGSGIDRDLRDILRFGLYQLLCLGTPEHAAVHETVELAAKKQRNVVNAILRTATRQRSHCSFERRIRNFLWSAGNSTLATNTQKSCANGTIFPRGCMRALIY
jgi:16S rRNA (cytosine967-C5)-methyltransferase